MRPGPSPFTLSHSRLLMYTAISLAISIRRGVVAGLSGLRAKASKPTNQQLASWQAAINAGPPTAAEKQKAAAAAAANRAHINPPAPRTNLTQLHTRRRRFRFKLGLYYITQRIIHKKWLLTTTTFFVTFRKVKKTI